MEHPPALTRAAVVEDAAEPAGRSIASYFDAFSPAPRWEELPAWPPDVFALANLVLDHTEGYRFAIAPIPGWRWPPTPGWNDEVVPAAGARRDLDLNAGVPPELVACCWAVVTRERDVPLAKVRSGEAWELCEALLTLHAAADEASAGLAAGGSSVEGSFEARARAMLERRGSLSHLSPTRVRIVPKTHFGARASRSGPCRGTSRSSGPPDGPTSNIGFRCARDHSPPIRQHRLWRACVAVRRG
jgi:hypothetical protein